MIPGTAVRSALRGMVRSKWPESFGRLLGMRILGEVGVHPRRTPPVAFDQA